MTFKKVVALCLEIIILGILVGLVISLYQFLMDKIIDISNEIFASSNYILLTICLVLAILLSFVIIYFNQKYKGYLGSGLPQYEAYYDNKLDFSSAKMFIFVLIDSFYAYFCGYVLGGEGPSITLASSMAKMTTKDKEVIAACGSAGFSVAFLAPLAGFFHLIEENRDFLRPSFLLKGFFIILIASTVGYFVFPHNLLPYLVDSFLDYKYYYLIVIVTIMAFIVGRLYVLALVKVKDLSLGFKYFLYLTPIFTLIFLYFKTKDLNFIGSGSTILNDPLFTTSISLAVFYLVYRLLGTAFSNSLAVSGGLVMPMLTLGAICGLITTLCFKKVVPDINKYTNILVVIGMVVLYNSVCKTPLTALALSFKMGKINYIILPVLIGLILSTGLVFLTRRENIYKLLEKRIINHAK